jgi:hypothetical protein
MQKKAIASLLSKSTKVRVFMAAPQAPFHSSKAANVEVSIMKVKVLYIDDR